MLDAFPASVLSGWTALLMLLSCAAGQLSTLDSTQLSSVDSTLPSTLNVMPLNPEQLSGSGTTHPITTNAAPPTSNATDARDVDSGGDTPRTGVLSDNANALSDQLLSCINQAYQPKLMNWEAAMRDELVSLRALGAWWSSKPSPVDIPVTVVTAATLDRLPQLAAQCRSWRGRVSAAVFFPIAEFSKTPHSGRVEDMSAANHERVVHAINRTTTFFENMERQQTWCKLDILLLYEVFNDKQSMSLFPVNVLRNVARLQARTPLLALVDVDLSISGRLYASLAEDANKTQSMVERARSGVAFILPAFETASETRGAANMADRIVQFRDKNFVARAVNVMGVLRPFASGRSPAGHGCTNFTRWFKSGKKEYSVDIGRGCEPWVIVDRMVAPWHDVRFTGYGFNKVVHLQHLSAARFQFVVHPTGFLVHRPHKPSGARQKYILHYVKWMQTPEDQREANSTNMWHHYQTIKSRMNEMLLRGEYIPPIDNATAWCSTHLPWWEGLQSLQRNS